MKRYCISCIELYDYGTSLYCEKCEWLVKQFEYDYCTECSGDETNHTLEYVLGNPFAKCKQILPFDCTDFETFLHQYVDTALWSSTNDTENGEMGNGNSFQSDNYDIEDLSLCCLQQMKHDCLDFMVSNWDMIKDDVSQAGHDFWLTRNGHGAGFWDGDWGEFGDKLTDESKPYGSVYLYLGDDEKIYSHG
jgi:hypothetical protein